MRITTLLLAAPLALLVPLSAAPQDPANQDATGGEDPLAVLEPLIGRWEGSGVGPSGTSATVVTVERVLGGRFVHMRTRAEFRPEGADPASEPTEVHEDWGMFSYDQDAKVVRLRQWHVEGFVNTYALDAEPAREGWTSFTSTAIENFAPDWRARQSHRLRDGVFSSTLELAGPGQDWFTCVRTELRRAD